jgi:hypothetical protein
VTERAPLIRIEHGPDVALHAPDQPANAEPVAGDGVRVTMEPAPKRALHVVPQLMPVGFDATVPDPVPLLATVSRAFTVRLPVLMAVPPGVVTRTCPVVASGGIGAVIVVALTTVKLVASLRLKDTLVAPVRFVPVIVTTVPVVAEVGLRPLIVGMRWKPAVTKRAPLMRTSHGPDVALHAPDHPAKMPVATVAVRRTTDPAVKSPEVALQLAPQAMPAGVVLTDPVPVPVLATESRAITCRTAVLVAEPPAVTTRT